MLKEMLDTEQTQWQKKVIQLELKNVDLEQAVAELKKEKTEIESEKDALISEQAAKEQLHTIMIQQKQSEADKALETLKQKASELCKAKISEGRLQIEVNQLKTEVKEYKDKLEFCIVGYKKKFEDLTREHEIAKRQNCKKCEVIEALFEKLIDEDDEFCQNSLKSETSGNLDSDEKFEMIKNVLQESYLEKKKHVLELVTLMKTAEEGDKSLQLSQNLNQELSGKNDKLSRRVSDICSEVVALKKENLECKEVIRNLKQELEEIEKVATTLQDQNQTAESREKNLESQVSSLTKILSDLKVEMLELEKLSESFQKTNDQLSRDLGDKERQLNSLNEEIESLKKRDEEQTQTSESLQKKYQLLLNKVRASLATIAKQKNSLEERDRIIHRLQDEVRLSRQAGKLCSTGQGSEKASDSISDTSLDGPKC